MYYKPEDFYDVRGALKTVLLFDEEDIRLLEERMNYGS